MDVLQVHTRQNATTLGDEEVLDDEFIYVPFEVDIVYHEDNDDDDTQEQERLVHNNNIGSNIIPMFH